jgi:hypothetical protein
VTDAEFLDHIAQRIRGRARITLTREDRLRLQGTRSISITHTPKRSRSVNSAEIHEHLHRRRAELVRRVTEQLQR